MPMRRIEDGQIRAGIPLPCDIHDRAGRLMLRAGQIIPGDHQVARLIEQGIFGDLELDDEAQTAPRADRISVYAKLAELRAAVARELDSADSPDRVEPFHVAMAAHAATLSDLCALDADAALGSVLLQREPDYSVRQAVNTAIVTELLLVQRNVDVTTRRAALAAALTMNIGMRSLQNDLYSQPAPLSEDQKAAILAHPVVGARTLKSFGVPDTAWLSTVAQHHELLDGSGYPGGLTGEQVSEFAQVVGLADRYCAMVSERAYRPGTPPNAALREIFLTQGKGVDPVLAAQMVKELGIYPPGALVQLANGESAVVVKRTLNSGQPIVRAVLSGAGLRLPATPKRRTSHPSFAIAQALPHARMPANLDGASLWAMTAADDPAEQAAES